MIPVEIHTSHKNLTCTDLVAGMEYSIQSSKLIMIKEFVKEVFISVDLFAFIYLT